MKSLATALLIFVGFSSAFASEPAPALRAGQLIEEVLCTADPTESYALYLPSNYSPDKRWPILYAFDPVARGKLPVTLFKDAAEKYGYIVAGSNNSRNFALQESSKSANAIWIDTHARFSLDEKQIYTTGFSGGARVAGLVASNCPQCNVSGVIAQGAGYWDPQKPVTGNLLYYLTVGDEDFNWSEVIGVRRERENSGTPCRVRVFAGPHQWAPAPLLMEAVEWIHLKAMQSGRRASNSDFIESMFYRAKMEAEAADRSNDAIAQLAAYRLLVSDFRGLKPIHDYESKLAELKKSAALKRALKAEEDEMMAQQSLTRDTSVLLAKFADAALDDRISLKRDIRDSFSRLHSQGELPGIRNKLYKRCFNDLWAQGVEAGQAAMTERHFDTAINYFQLMADVSPQEPWPMLLIAEASAEAGNKKEAMKAVRAAIKRGLKNVDALAQNQNLEMLRSDPEFQAIIAELKKN
jgi:dienelactone hydrolase